MPLIWSADEDYGPGESKADEAYRAFVRPPGWLALLVGIVLACRFGRGAPESELTMAWSLACSFGIVLATVGMGILSRREWAWYAFFACWEMGVFVGFLLVLDWSSLGTQREAPLFVCGIMALGAGIAGIVWMIIGRRAFAAESTPSRPTVSRPKALLLWECGPTDRRGAHVDRPKSG